MTLLNDATETKKFDVRVIERNIQRGRITQDEAKKSVDALPDDGDNAEYIAISDIANDEKKTG